MLAGVYFLHVVMGLTLLERVFFLGSAQHRSARLVSVSGFRRAMPPA